MYSGGLSFPQGDLIESLLKLRRGKEKARKLQSVVDLAFRHSRFSFVGECHRIMVMKSIVALVFLSWVGDGLNQNFKSLVPERYISSHLSEVSSK